MRNIGSYGAEAIPSINDLIISSTPARTATLLPMLPRLNAAATRYLAAIPDLHTLRAIRLTEQQRLELTEAYDERTVAMRRLIATMIASLTPGNRDVCPYCSLDSNPDLDHYLPKAVYPEFSLLAVNLIPICTNCNRRKGNSVADDQGRRQFILATHDLLDSPDFVVASISVTAELTVTYSIDSSRLSQGDADLVERHFRRLGLADRFRTRAIAHLAATKSELVQFSQGVKRRTLTSMSTSGLVGEPQNGWKRPLYRAVTGNIQQVLNWL